MKYTNILSKLLKRNTYRKNTIIILIGHFSSFLAACTTKGFVRAINISKQDTEYIGKYRSFLNQFKGWQVVILLDTEDVKLEHKSLPAIQSLYTKNPIRVAIKETYSPLEFVAYNPYQIENGNPDIWHTNIVHSKLSPEVDDIISFIYHSNFPLAGIYFLTLEIKEILAEILQDEEIFLQKNLIIFVTTTISSGLRIFVIHNNLVLLSKSVPISGDFSSEYIKGLIEQEVEQIITQYQNYNLDHKLSSQVVSITNKEIADLLKNQRTGVKWYGLATSDIKQTAAYADFSDGILIYNLVGQYLAANSKLRKVFSLELFNKTFFKPVIILTGILTCFICYTHIRSIYSNKALKNLNNEYYKTSEEYRDARQKLQNINNLATIYDILSDFALLKAKYQNPTHSIQKILNMKNDMVSINSIRWKITSNDVGAIESEMDMGLKFTEHNSSLSLLRDKVAEYNESLSNIFPKYKIEYLEDRNDVINLPTKVMIPVTFIFKGSFE